MHYFNADEKFLFPPWQYLCYKKRMLFLDDSFATEQGPAILTLPADLMALDSQSSEPIKLVINSPGGQVDLIFLVYDVMRGIRSPVYTLGASRCHSGAALLLMAGQEGKRFMLPHACVRLHYPMFVVSRMVIPGLPGGINIPGFTPDGEGQPGEESEDGAKPTWIDKGGEMLRSPDRLEMFMKTNEALPKLDPEMVRKTIEESRIRMMEVIKRHCGEESAAEIKQRLDAGEEVELSPAECLDFKIVDKIAESLSEFLHDIF